MHNATYYIKHLNLQAHPEGGYYCETFRSKVCLSQESLKAFDGERNLFTSIYFLIEKSNFSVLHKIKSDELWNFHNGDSLEIIEISQEGTLTITHLGKNAEHGEQLQHVVEAGNWFGSRVKPGGDYSLVGCVVSPGFDFRDFEIANRTELTEQFPAHNEIIEALTR